MSQRLFEAYPPFPEDVQTASIPKVSLAQLVAGNQDEALGTFRACRTMGFFLLDLKGEANGEKLLHDIDTLFGIVEDVMDLSLEEKIRYKQNPPADYIGYVISAASFYSIMEFEPGKIGISSTKSV